MSELLKTPEPQPSAAEETSPNVEKKTPNKRGRMSFIERAQKESEELVKTMGGSLELEGGRRTRSSARGTPSRPAVVTPPPAKKARNSPASPKSTPRARGRGRKLDTADTPEPPEQQQIKEKKENLETSTPTTSENDASKEEKPETNGPEKSGEEHVNENALEESKKVEDEVKKVENEQPAPKEVDEADQVDAALESVQEKQQEKQESANEAAKTKESAQIESILETVAADSPMDVDEQSGSQDAAVVQHKPKFDSLEVCEAEASAATIIVAAQSATKPETISELVSESVEIQKQPTPEPMEVDSSSKSSDVIDCTDVVDKAEAAVETTSSVKQLEDKSVAEICVNDSLVAPEKVDEPLTQTQSNSEENGTTGEANANEVTENDISAAPVVAETKSIDASAATEEPKIESVIESKTDNKIVEPKLISPQLNPAGDAAVTTV